jgi:6-phosphogluconolactonase (cycloisomerase 2 family)
LGEVDRYAYEIDQDTWALTTVSGSAFATGAAPVSVTVDPLGKFVFGANHWGDPDEDGPIRTPGRRSGRPRNMLA